MDKSTRVISLTPCPIPEAKRGGAHQQLQQSWVNVGDGNRRMAGSLRAVHPHSRKERLPQQVEGDGFCHPDAGAGVFIAYLCNLSQSVL